MKNENLNLVLTVVLKHINFNSSITPLKKTIMKKQTLLSVFGLLMIFNFQYSHAQGTTITIDLSNSVTGMERSGAPTIPAPAVPDFAAYSWTCGGSPCIGRTLMSVDLSAIPSNATILYATLSVYADPQCTYLGYFGQPTYGTQNRGVIKRITSPWDPNTVTWNNITKEIHELNTTTNITLTDAINFYKEGEHRSRVEQKVIEAISNGMAFDFEAIIVTAKGHERWVRATGKPEFIRNKCVRLFGVIQDIHDNKLAEIQLLEANKAITQSNERFEYVTKATFDAIWDWDLETNTFFRGEGFETLFGNRYKEQLNSKISWNVIHPEDQAEDDNQAE